MLDLSDATFCVPITDAHSPIAYAIVSETHWYDPDEYLKIAPAFFYSQVDLCGPFSAYSPANKRATLKIWIVVFVCTVTGAIDCRIMENYDTQSFILAFTRFSCRFGYPKMLMPDEGSQLMRECKDMVIFVFRHYAQTLDWIWC